MEFDARDIRLYLTRCGLWMCTIERCSGMESTRIKALQTTLELAKQRGLTWAPREYPQVKSIIFKLESPEFWVDVVNAGAKIESIDDNIFSFDGIVTLTGASMRIASVMTTDEDVWPTCTIAGAVLTNGERRMAHRDIARCIYEWNVQPLGRTYWILGAERFRVELLVQLLSNFGPKAIESFKEEHTLVFADITFDVETAKRQILETATKTLEVLGMPKLSNDTT